MKTPRLILTVMAVLLLFGGAALAAKPPGAGNGGGNEGGGEPPDFGDLFILNRNASGVPILDENLCQQPIAFPSDTCVEGCWTEVDGVMVVTVDPATCAISTACATCTREIDFGRSNVVRSPVSVLESALEDVVTTLATADCISLDPSGRLVASTLADDGVTVLSGAIDSPLQNLAIYRQLLLNGSLGVALPDGIDLYDTAARGLGAANDKTGSINVDMVVYINQILGLSDLETTIFGAPTCQSNKEEVSGVVRTVEKCFLNFAGYSYYRDQNFGSLPSPAYIPQDAPLDGWFEYLDVLPPEEGSPDLFFVNQGEITTVVFNDETGFVEGNIGGFAQAADDTRAVIDFMHSHPLPLGYETPVPLLCDISGDDIYDVSISDISGLQVPVRMVAGTEGREFTLTVANAGDFATGTVELTAVAADGTSIPTFPRSFAFELVGGTSTSWTEGFSIDEKTTVTWTATAIPDCASCDLNLANNSVTETTLTTGGGSGGPVR